MLLKAEDFKICQDTWHGVKACWQRLQWNHQHLWCFRLVFVWWSVRMMLNSLFGLGWCYGERQGVTWNATIVNYYIICVAWDWNHAWFVWHMFGGFLWRCLNLQILIEPLGYSFVTVHAVLQVHLGALWWKRGTSRGWCFRAEHTCWFACGDTFYPSVTQKISTAFSFDTFEILVMILEICLGRSCWFSW